MSIQLTTVDAFILPEVGVFSGNPAAVCILPGPAEEKWMQSVAQEMNLAETAYIWPEGNVYRLRWFTPAIEVDLCGHATLASTHVLFNEGHVPKDQTIAFETRSGRLEAKPLADGAIELDFPATPVTKTDTDSELLASLGISEPVEFVGRTKFDAFVAVKDEASVRDLKPDFLRLSGIDVRGTIVTAPPTTPGCDFVSRFFGPRAGIPEDHATGSAHCALACYWAEKFGRTELVGRQLSPRGAQINVRLANDRVFLSGRAQSVMQCAWLA